MSDTPLTQSRWDEHRHFANEEEATEAILDFRDLCRKLERENARLLAWIQQTGNEHDFCTFDAHPNKLCEGCNCHRKHAQT